MQGRANVVRTQGASLSDLDGEALLYLKGDPRVHLLDHPTLVIYRHCERLSLAELGQAAYPGLSDKDALALVLEALDELERIGALTWLSDKPWLSNRRFLRATAQGAPAPVILSLVLPSPTQAASASAAVPSATRRAFPETRKGRRSAPSVSS